MSLLSYAYTDEMTFAPLQTSICESDPVAGTEVQQQWSCSPRSMYSLATTVGVSYGYIDLSADVLKAWDSRRRGGCFKGHPIETLHHQHRTGTFYLLRCKVCIYRLRSFVSSRLDLFSHTAVTDMGVQFLHEYFTEKVSKSLMGHIRIMASGEAPFFAMALSLVYDKLVEKAFAQPVPSGSGLGKSAEVESAADPSPPLQPSTSTFGFTCASPVSTSIPRTPAPNPRPGSVSSSTATQLTWLRCHSCHWLAALAELGDGLRCPQCLQNGSNEWPPLMQCTLCHTMRTARSDKCLKRKCTARFR